VAATSFILSSVSSHTHRDSVSDVGCVSIERGEKGGDKSPTKEPPRPGSEAGNLNLRILSIAFLSFLSDRRLRSMTLIDRGFGGSVVTLIDRSPIGSVTFFDQPSVRSVTLIDAPTSNI
jgi:hypothetical protein